MTVLLAIRAFLSRIPWQLWAAIALVIVTAVGVTQCTKHRNAAAQAKLERAQAQAAVESGKDAINTAGNVSDRQSAGEALGRDNERNIRNAQGSETKAGPAATGAGISSLCGRAAYRDSERCRVRGAPAR